MELLARSSVHTLDVSREGDSLAAVVSVSACDWPTLEAGREKFLHPHEEKHLQGAGVRKRQADFLRGRYCAKQALSALRPEVDPRSIWVASGAFGQPVVRSGSVPNVAVSIAHSGDWAAALAFDEGHPMAIDLQINDRSHDEVIRRTAQEEELKAFAVVGVAESEALTLLWTAWEGLGKVLKTGLMTPFSLYQVSAVEPAAFGVVCSYRNFGQYKSYCGAEGKLAVTITLPRKSFLQFDSRILTVAAR